MKRIALVFLCAALIAGVFSGCSGMVSSAQNAAETETISVTTFPTEETEAPDQTVPEETQDLTVVSADFKIALIAENCFDQRWQDLETGAMKAMEELGCEVVNMSPWMQDDEHQAEQIHEAVSTGCHGIVIAPMESETVAEALGEAAASGVKIICVNTTVDIGVEASFVTDGKTAGKTAAETLLTELEAREITEGSIAIIGMQDDHAGALQRETGFREILEETAFALMEVQYCEGDAAKAHAIARELMKQEAVAVFAAGEAAVVGAGNAAKELKSTTVVVGFGEPGGLSELCDDGYVHALVVGQYENMGYQAVRAACAAVSGRDLGGAVTDTGVSVLPE